MTSLSNSWAPSSKRTASATWFASLTKRTFSRLASIGGTAIEDDDAVLCAVREHSAVGESASNGKSERSVQQLEDQVRTLKSALEERIGARLGSTHSVMGWLVRHCSSILTRFAVNPDGRMPYQVTHGKRAVDKLVEFGERVYN